MPLPLLFALLLGAMLPGTAQAQTRACPENAMELAPGSSLRCNCRPDAVLDGTVWGTDTYTADSRICRAARHAGVISRHGGPVQLDRLGAQESYAGSTRNGVQTEDYNSFDNSFRFTRLEQPAQTGPMLCPDTFRPYQADTTPLQCLCPGEMTQLGDVWGTDVYTADSSLCRAALHAGVVPMAGGVVTAVPMPGQASYAASLRNGVRSSGFNEWPASFSFDTQSGQSRQPPAAAPIQAPVAASLAARGQVQLYITFRTNSADIDASALPLLHEVRRALADDLELRLHLVGHTDNTGTPAINRPLSQRRALAVRNFLVTAGIPGDRLTVEGKGPDQPIADNATEAGRALNRRVQAIRRE